MAKTTGNKEATTRVRYTDADKREALTYLAVSGGSTEKAAEDLAERFPNITGRTLRYWRQELPELYTQAQEELAPKIEKQIEESLRATVNMAGAVKRDAILLEHERIKAGQVKDAAASARNMATVEGIGTDKLLALTGRPTHIVEQRNADELLRKLSTQLPGLIVEGTATEITEDERQIEQGSPSSQPSAHSG